MSGEIIDRFGDLKSIKSGIKALVFDVDGVLTDSSLLITESGELLRTMNTRDGLALKQAVKAGFHVAIMTGGGSKGVISRLRNLGIADIYVMLQDKTEAFEEFLHQYDLKEEEVAYMGDDWPDYEVMQRCGFPACPADAIEEIRGLSQFVARSRGGAGCVREFIEDIMRAQLKWPEK